MKGGFRLVSRERAPTTVGGAVRRGLGGDDCRRRGRPGNRDAVFDPDTLPGVHPRCGVWPHVSGPAVRGVSCVPLMQRAAPRVVFSPKSCRRLNRRSSATLGP